MNWWKIKIKIVPLFGPLLKDKNFIACIWRCAHNAEQKFDLLLTMSKTQNSENQDYPTRNFHSELAARVTPIRFEFMKDSVYYAYNVFLRDLFFPEARRKDNNLSVTMR